MIRPLRGDGDLLAFEEGGMPSPRQVLILDFRMINLNTAKATSTETRERLRCGPSSSRQLTRACARAFLGSLESRDMPVG